MVSTLQAVLYTFQSHSAVNAPTAGKYSATSVLTTPINRIELGSKQIGWQRTNGPARRRMMGCSTQRCGEAGAVLEVREEAMRGTSGPGEEAAGVGLARERLDAAGRLGGIAAQMGLACR